MNTNGERLAQLEERIEILEKELQALKKEVAVLKVTEEVEVDATDSIYGMFIEDMNLSVRAFNCLKRAGINTLGDLVLSSEEDLMKVRCLGRKSYDEVMLKVKELTSNPADTVAKIQAEIKRKEEEKALDFEMSKKLLSAIEVYARIRMKAKEENICFISLGRHGKFPSLLHRWSVNDIRYSLERGEGVLGRTFCQNCLNGEYPKMKELFCAEEVTMDLIKAAILEDVTEAIRYMKKETNTYQEFLRFVKLIQEFDG